jgi:hypothetical protein
LQNPSSGGEQVSRGGAEKKKKDGFTRRREAAKGLRLRRSRHAIATLRVPLRRPEEKACGAAKPSLRLRVFA